MGFLAALMLQSKGILATLIDPYAGDNKRRIAETLDLKLQQTISSLEPPPDLVIELSGSPDGLVDALSHTGHNTLVTVLGIYGMPASLEPSLLNHCVFSDVQMVFSVNASRLDYETAASMLSEVGHHRLKSLVTRELSLTNWTDGLQRSGDHIKSLIRFSD
jgi:threonine dehydrogenase-like Zn-dependent dehydrogenase